MVWFLYAVDSHQDKGVAQPTPRFWVLRNHGSERGRGGVCESVFFFGKGFDLEGFGAGWFVSG